MNGTLLSNQSTIKLIMSRSFDIQALINGDMSQLNLFTDSNGIRSLYVEWVPDELTKEIAMDYFSNLGPVSAVDFVKQKTGKARMMFVHFDNFYHGYIRHVNDIALAHPNAHEMPISFRTKNPHYPIKEYKLRCRINTKPIQRVEYNAAQLTDMVDRLRKELEELKEEVAALKVKPIVVDSDVTSS
jgi:hypothetical protein